MIINCLAIDDEPLALDIIEEYVSKVPFLNLVNKCTDVMLATETLKNEQIDLLFLDIQMPQLTGIEFLNTLDYKPAVIFTTAYDEYAVESYSFNTIDYLLKPISFERFMKAANKAHDTLNVQSEVSNDKKYLFIKTDYKIQKIDISDIQYMEGYKDYVKIYTDKERFVTRESMKNMETLLPADNFIRVHRSFIISVEDLKYIMGNILMIGEKEIPIGKSYKENVMRFLNIK